MCTLSSYEAVRHGMDFLAEKCRGSARTCSRARRVLRYVAERQLLLQRPLPPHDAGLRSIAGMRH